MAAEARATQRAPIALSFTTNLVIALAVLILGGAVIQGYGAEDSALHTVLDSSIALTGALIALLLWDVSRRSDESWNLFLALSFAWLALGELLHVVAVLGWLGGGDGTDVLFRSGTWGPPAHLLPLGVGAALLLRERRRSLAWLFALGLALLALALVAIFLSIPRYTEPGFLLISRPTLVLVPLLWVVVGAAYWRYRDESEIARAIALTAVILAIAHTVMLYSRAPSDPVAMVAHLGKFVGDALLLFNLTQIGAADTQRLRQAERELKVLNRELDLEHRRGQGLIEAIFETSATVIYVKDLAGRYLMVNRRFCDIFNFDRTAVIGKTDPDFFPTATPDLFRAMVERLSAADGPLIEQETASLEDGRHVYISVKSPLRDEAGQIYAVFSIATDVTHLKRTEEALLASEQRHGRVVESALDCVVSIDDTGAITGWNPQAERTFGWTRAEVLGRPVEHVIMPVRYREAHRQGLARYLATGEARVLNRRIELEALRRDDEEFPVELSISPIHIGDTVSFTAFVRDISDRRLADSRLQSQLDRLHLLEQITRAIGQRHDVRSVFQVVVRTLEDQLPADFVCVCTYDSARHSITVAHIGVGSVPLGRELGMTAHAEIAIDENGLSRCVSGELVYEPDIAEVDFPFPARLARQGLRSLVIAPLQFESEVFGVLVVARGTPQAFLSSDCEFLRQLAEHVGLAAHQAQLRDSLQQAYDDLRHTQQAVVEQERLRAIGQMASGIAHDINNAISPVAVYTQSLIEREMDLPSEVHNYLEIVGRVVKDISATVARMRDFYRADSGEAGFEPIDLNELVPQVVELTRARWSDMPQQRGAVITVSTTLEADLPSVMGNASEIREAMTNLIFNAVDAMPDGGRITIGTAKVRSASSDRPRVRLEVGDTGPGMDAETRKRCLEPFFTTKGERGTGLGLAMVYGAAQRHQAQLEIDSAPGAGTRVRLEFAAAPAAQSGKRRASIPHDIRPLRLLLVDDDPAVLKSTVYVLGLNGHTVTGADGGQAAIDALHAAHDAGESFDAVITDLGMPYVDGNQVARTVKDLFPSMPVVLLTGWGRRMTNGDEAPAHVDFVLPKPLELDELREIFAGLG